MNSAPIAAATTAMIIANNNRTQRENKERRFRNIETETNDQIYLKFDKSKEIILKRLHRFLGTDGEEDGILFKNPKKKFSLTKFIITFIITFLLIYGTMWIFKDWDKSISFFNTYTVIGGFIVGLIAGFINLRKEIDYIKIGTNNHKTTVIIKKFDSEGYRNIDEDDLERLLNVLEGKN